MAKTRLRNDDRDSIRDAIMDHKFSPLEKALRAEENALAIQVRAKAYGDYLPVMEAAPKGAFATQSEIEMNVSGRRLRLRFGADRHTTATVFDDHRHGFIMSVTEADKLGAKALAWALRAEDLKTERRTLAQKLRATLGSFNSFDDLLAGWPEADKFITARWRVRGTFVSNVPAVTIAELTGALDLPPEVPDAIAA